MNRFVEHGQPAKTLCRDLANWYEYEELDKAHPAEDISEYVNALTEQLNNHIIAHILNINAGYELPISKEEIVSRFGPEMGNRKVKNIQELLDAHERHIDVYLPTLKKFYNPTVNLV